MVRLDLPEVCRCLRMQQPIDGNTKGCRRSYGSPDSMLVARRLCLGSIGRTRLAETGDFYTHKSDRSRVGARRFLQHVRSEDRLVRIGISSKRPTSGYCCEVTRPHLDGSALRLLFHSTEVTTDLPVRQLVAGPESSWSSLIVRDTDHIWKPSIVSR